MADEAEWQKEREIAQQRSGEQPAEPVDETFIPELEKERAAAEEREGKKPEPHGGAAPRPISSLTRQPD
jgi:hypothetical protein